jgi:uncharacterized protein YicC (UPF0701 family)
MEYLDIIYTQTVMNAVILSMELSIEDLKNKNPHRTDLIEGMDKHAKAMREAIFNVREMEKELRTIKSISYNYHRENMELKFERDQLKEQCKNLMSGL